MIFVLNVSGRNSFFLQKTLSESLDLGNTPSSNVPIISLIISSTLLNMFFYKMLPSSVKPLIKSYIISTIHALVSLIGVLNYICKYEMNFLQINRIVGGGISGTGDEIMVYSVCY